MKKQHFLLCFLTLCCLTASISAGAQININGRVKTDDTNEYLEFVSVVVKGTTKGTVTNMEGAYSIGNLQPRDTIQFVYMGYKTVQVAVSDLVKSPDVVMPTLATNLQEIVVKALQEEDILKSAIQKLKYFYPSEPVICKSQIKDVTIENKKIASYYDFAADLWVYSFLREEEERNPTMMRIRKVDANIDRYTDSIPVRPYVMYDKTIRTIIPENYALHSIMSMIETDELKFKISKDSLGLEEIYRMTFESKGTQNDINTSATIERVSGYVIVTVADSSILKIQMEEEFNNYTTISHFYKGAQRVQCTATFEKQVHSNSFRRVGNRMYPEYAKTEVFSNVKYNNQTLERRQMSLILINDIITKDVKRFSKKESYDKSQPLYRQISAENDSWRTINSLPLTQEEKDFIDANR
ncbi:MAG: carboxypeptidase-like regulatory domain-containing protein [Prevotellaceae bacterium]|jgi:uncharacterized membrane protein YcaP (DUF421 family)|nr:carboxypeptidase-like regulatory domain-containing protein [Prevotellaceae bacterium]